MPRSKRIAAQKRKAPKYQESDSEDEGYIVEAILDYEVDEEGNEKYYIKWEGYEEEEDNTWEPIENLDCPDKVLQFWKDRHARGEDVPDDFMQQVSSIDEFESQLPREITALKSWDDLIESIEAEDLLGVDIQFTLTWKDSEWVTKHKSGEVHEKCPLKALAFYASRLESHEVDKEEV